MTDQVPPLFYLKTTPSRAVTAVSRVDSTAVLMLLQAFAPRVHVRVPMNLRLIIDTDSITMGWVTNNAGQSPLDIVKDALTFLFDQPQLFDPKDGGTVILTDPSRMILAPHGVWDRPSLVRSLSALACSNIHVDSNFGQALLAANGTLFSKEKAHRVMILTGGQRFHPGDRVLSDLRGEARNAGHKGINWVVVLVGAVTPDVLNQWCEFAEAAGPDSTVLCAPTTQILIETLRFQLSLMRSRRVRNLRVNVRIADSCNAGVTSVVRLTPRPRSISFERDGFEEGGLELGDVYPHEWLIGLALPPMDTGDQMHPILSLEAEAALWDESEDRSINSVAQMRLTDVPGHASKLKMDVHVAQQVIAAHTAMRGGDMDLASACFGTAQHRSQVSIVDHLKKLDEPSH